MTTEDKTQIQYLLSQYLDGKATSKQAMLLTEYINQYKEDEEWLSLLEELMATEKVLPVYEPAEWQSFIEDIKYKNQTNAVQTRAVRRIGLFKTAWFRYAAILIILLGIGGAYFLMQQHEKPNPGIVQSVPLKTDIPPGKDGALLTLSDGNSIVLDDVGKGKLAIQGNTKIIKLDSGRLSYQPGGQGGEVSYNTLSTPRGRQFRIELPDGTDVWLNAASSLTYPTAFTGNERKVKITGEAYFEVAANARMPFRVQLREGAEIEVLGTHFNVMAYANENTLETTLLEGSVTFRKGGNSILLKPGQQSRLINGERLRLVKNVNVEQVVAWKNGMQSFSNADLKTIMRKVERWYDVDVEFQGNITRRQFGGDIPREANLSEFLKLLKVNKVHFRLDATNKKLLIMP